MKAPQVVMSLYDLWKWVVRACVRSGCRHSATFGAYVKRGVELNVVLCGSEVKSTDKQN